MLGKIGDLYVSIGARTQNATKGLSDVEDKLGGLSKKFTSLKIIVGGLVSGGILGGFIHETSKMETSITNLGTLFHQNIGEAKNYYKELMNIHRSSPLSMDSLVQGLDVIKGYGAVVDKDLIPTMKMLGDLARGNEEHFNWLSLAFGQAMASGRLSGQDANQMITNFVNPYELIGFYLNKSIAQVKAMSKKGQISSELLLKSLQKATEKGGLYFKGLAASSGTLTGKMNQLRGSFNNFQIAVGSQLLPTVKKIADVFTNLFNKLTEAPDWFKKLFAGGLAIGVGIPLLGGVLKFASSFLGLAKPLIPILMLLGKGILFVSRGLLTLIANPIGLAITGIVAALYGLVRVVGLVGEKLGYNWGKKLSDGMRSLEGYVSNLIAGDSLNVASSSSHTVNYNVKTSGNTPLDKKTSQNLASDMKNQSSTIFNSKDAWNKAFFGASFPSGSS